MILLALHYFRVITINLFDRSPCYNIILNCRSFNYIILILLYIPIAVKGRRT